MKKIKLFTMLFLCVFMMNAQKNKNPKQTNQTASAQMKGNAGTLSNVLDFDPENQTITAQSGTDKVATIVVSHMGSNPGNSTYLLYQTGGPIEGLDGNITNVNGIIANGDDDIDITFTFNLDVTADVSYTYEFRVNLYDQNGNNTQKDLTITVNYVIIDSDGDGIPDSEDDCPNDYGPSSNNGCPDCQLDAPNNRTTTDIGDTEATLNWNNVSDNQGYQIKYRKGSGSFMTDDVSTNVTSLNFTNLDPNSTYQWKVATKCNNLVGDFSSLVSFTTLLECNLPVPSGFAASDVNANNAAISWNSVSGNSGYQSQYKEVSASNWINVSNGSLGTAFVIINLQPENTYQARVRTRCSNGGFGDWSQIEQFTTPLCGANPPSTITISSTNSNYTNINWNSVFGSYGYNSEYSVLGSNNWVTISNNSPGTGFSVINLSPSTSYEVRVRTRCQNGYYGEWNSETFISSARMAQVNLFPNPAKNQIKVESDNPIKNWEITNTFGRSLIKNHDFKIDTKKEINISSLPIGLYFINIELESGKKVIKRLIKQ